MISWIQRSFQQHFRTVFAVLLAVTIISFIFTIGASPGIGRAGPKVLRQRFFGYDLGRQGASDRVFGDANISVQLEMGSAALSSVDSAALQQFAYTRAAALAIADQLKIPAPTKDELTAYIRSLPAFLGSDGQFNASHYAAFRDNLRTNPRITEGDILHVISDDFRISRVQQLLAGPGYVLPGEVKDGVVRADSTWSLEIATTDYSAFKPEIPVNEDALKRFFEDNAFRYDVPARVAVDYVEFRAADFIGGVTVTDAEVRTYYDENRGRFPAPHEKKTEGDKKPAQPNVAAPDNPDADFAAVRPAVEQALKTERAMRLAAKAAADLTVALYEDRLKPHTPACDEYLAKNKLSPRQVAPFCRDTVPADLGWTPQIVDEALQLTADRPVSDALPFPGGSLVLFWRDTLPPYRPELAGVRDHVVADYKENERRKRFVEAGQALRQQLEARLKGGESFEQAAAASATLKLEVKTYPAFSARQPPQDILRFDFSQIGQLQSGQLSELLLTEDKGAFVFVKERKMPDLAGPNPQYAAMRAQLARMNAGLSQSLALNEMVARELKKIGSAADAR
ncbi:MAG TPA: peptidyl-prolyl cis-trans isomerase [Opitutaceae bacterium]|nr:peptidyl-prolyl cis-trans isomerase [Opitutaceae bacterium]